MLCLVVLAPCRCIWIWSPIIRGTSIIRRILTSGFYLNVREWMFITCIIITQTHALQNMRIEISFFKSWIILEKFHYFARNQHDITIVCRVYSIACIWRLNSLWPSNAIWQHRSRSTLTQVMACCLTAPSHYLNQCWLNYQEDPLALIPG